MALFEATGGDTFSLRLITDGAEMKDRMRNIGVVVCLAWPCLVAGAAQTWKLQGGDHWQSISDDPQQRYARALADLQELTQAGDAGEVKDAVARIQEDFPQRAGPGLELFALGELEFWKDRYAKAMVKFEKLLKDYPRSEFADPAMEREFEIGKAYLAGRKKTVLGLFRIRGYAEGVEIMERLSDRMGLDDPNSIGLKAAVAVAEHYEAREKYIEAYLKWSEIASYWEMGPVGKQALYRMAEDNFLAYNQPPEKRQPLLDASKLTTARAYYERFALRYPEDAKERDVAAKIKRIDEQMAYKQYTIGRYYQRTDEIEAAGFYYDMVMENWPQTEAARMAKDARQELIDRGQTREP